MYLAHRLISRSSLECSRFGQFHIIVAYRHLLYGHFDQVFENLRKGMEMHKAFGLHHHYRECMVMKAWIQHVLGLPRESMECFKAIYLSGKKDGDQDSQLWGMLGLTANYKHLGEHEKALEWLDTFSSLFFLLFSLCSLSLSLCV